MKKLILFAFAAITISFVSCTGKGNTETDSGAETKPTVIEEVEAVIPDSVGGDTAIVDEVSIEQSN